MWSAPHRCVCVGEEESNFKPQHILNNLTEQSSREAYILSMNMNIILQVPTTNWRRRQNFDNSHNPDDS